MIINKAGTAPLQEASTSTLNKAPAISEAVVRPVDGTTARVQSTAAMRDPMPGGVLVGLSYSNSATKTDLTCVQIGQRTVNLQEQIDAVTGTSLAEAFASKLTPFFLIAEASEFYEPTASALSASPDTRAQYYLGDSVTQWILHNNGVSDEGGNKLLDMLTGRPTKTINFYLLLDGYSDAELVACWHNEYTSEVGADPLYKAMLGFSAYQHSPTEAAAFSMAFSLVYLLGSSTFFPKTEFPSAHNSTIMSGMSLKEKGKYAMRQLTAQQMGWNRESSMATEALLLADARTVIQIAGHACVNKARYLARLDAAFERVASSMSAHVGNGYEL